MMANYLENGESFYLYTYWVGEKSNPTEGEVSLPLKGWYEECMELRESTLIKFTK